MAIVDTPGPADLVLWHVSQRQSVVVPRESADWIDGVADAFDAVPFAWSVTGGYIFVLLPRNLWQVWQ